LLALVGGRHIVHVSRIRVMGRILSKVDHEYGTDEHIWAYETGSKGALETVS
jgi:hypothetical protein